MGLSQQIGASSLIKPGVINSAAERPASPYEGQVIFQKDTDEILAYNGTSWSRPWNMPWGILAYQTRSTIGVTTTLADIGLSVTFTAVANRYYKYTFYSYASNSTSAGTFETYITDPSNVATGSLNLYLVAGANYTFQNLVYVSTETAGSVTRKVRAKCQAGTGTIYSPMYLFVEDIGPA